MAKFTDLELYITGPTYVRKEVLDAGLLPVFGHRDSEAKLRMEPITKNLRKIAGVDDSYIVMLIPGTGTDALEASIKSLVADNEKVLCIAVGPFGKLYYEIAVANGKNAELLEFEPGKAIDIDVLKEKLAESRPTVVTFTHNETSTGVTNNVVEVCKAIKEFGALPMVDGVSIFGGAPTHIMEAGVGVYSTSTQKCLGLPAGFGISIVDPAVLEKAKNVRNRGYMTDMLNLARSASKCQTVNTTPTQLANQLFFQTEYIVNEEGIERRFERHRSMRDMTHEWIKTLPAGFRLLPGNEYASCSVTCIEVPSWVDRDALKQKMKMHGYLFDPGYRELKLQTIRIGHMGDIMPEMLKKYLSILGEEINAMAVGK